MSRSNSTPKSGRKDTRWFMQWGVRGYVSSTLESIKILWNGKNVYGEYEDEPFKKRNEYAFEKWTYSYVQIFSQPIQKLAPLFSNYQAH